MNLIKHQQPDIDKIYLHVIYPFESKYQFLFNGRKEVGIEHLKNPLAFIDYSKTIDDDYENSKGYNPTKKMRVLIECKVLLLVDYLSSHDLISKCLKQQD